MIKLKHVINKHKSNKIKENSNTVRHLNNGTDHRHSKSCCDQSSPARRTIKFLRCWPLSRGFHRWQGPGTVMWKAFPRHDVIMVSICHQMCYVVDDQMSRIKTMSITRPKGAMFVLNIISHHRTNDPRQLPLFPSHPLNTQWRNHVPGP